MELQYKKKANNEVDSWHDGLIPSLHPYFEFISFETIAASSGTRVVDFVGDSCIDNYNSFIPIHYPDYIY